MTTKRNGLQSRLARLLLGLLLALGTPMAGAEVLYVHTDHLGTPRLMSNEQGVTVWRNLPTTEPFGNSPVEEDPDGDSVTTTLNPRFPGQYFDRETNLHDNWHRTYDPLSGRYTTADPLGLEGGINTYTYVEGNPVSFTDPMGLHKGDKWYGFNNREFQRWFHKCWKQAGNADADKQEIAEAYAEWVSRGSPTGGKCDNTPPPPPAPADSCGETCQKTATVVVAGGTAYVVYRCLRMLPSLLPPLWPTIPANAVVP